MKIDNAIDAKPWMGPLILLLVTLAFFGDLLFFSSTQVLSRFGNDLSSYFIYWRDFGFSQIASGNLPMWNPLAFSGLPYAGGFQAALFYPPNWIYLLLPLQKAINLDLALHVYFAGLFMFLWAGYRGLTPFASLVCGVLFMFCGAFFPHVYAGHLAPTAAMAWAPLIFLSADMLVKQPGAKAWALGVFALSMQVLAGYPQMVFFTGVAAGIYVLSQCALGRVRLKSLGLMAAMAVMAVFICAIQLFNAWEMGQESVRSSGLSFQNASIFSFPPENLLTLVAPGFFGLDNGYPYWGRWYFWEMCLFASVTGLSFFMWGLLGSQRKNGLVLGLCFGACLILALGANTPIFKVLFDHVPGFNMFRGLSKHIICASLFMIVLMGIGLDGLLLGKVKRIKTLAALLLGLGVVCGFAGLFVLHSAAMGSLGAWDAFFQWVQSSRQSYLPASDAAATRFMTGAGLHAARTLFISTGILWLAAVFVILSTRRQSFAYLVGILAMAEVVFFAWGVRDTFDITHTKVPVLKEVSQNTVGEHRVLNTVLFNSGPVTGLQEIWGYDPLILSRYAEFMALSQGKDPEHATYTLEIERYHPLFKLIRCRYVIQWENDSYRIIDAGETLPRAFLVNSFQVPDSKENIFSALISPDFNPKETVLLEKEPSVLPQESGKGTVRVEDLDTDRMLLHVEAEGPAILVITDIYARGWKASPVNPGGQSRYEVMPANHVLRAIPIEKGSHSIMLEYKPKAFTVGMWVTLASLIAFVCILAWAFMAKKSVQPIAAQAESNSQA